MRSWPTPFIPQIPGQAPEVRVRDTATGQVLPVATRDEVSLYVCGITPYDATHLGHAATYVTFDLLGRVLRDSGHRVRYVQNITDIDDPLLERAERDGIPWQELATREIALFREDMTALGGHPARRVPRRRREHPHLRGPHRTARRRRPRVCRARPRRLARGCARRLLRGGPRPALRLGQPPRRGRHARGLRRARRRPRPRGQARPARRAALAGAPRGRAGVGRRVARLGPARLAHRVRLHRPRPPRGARRRAGRRHRPDLPAPRDERRARSGPRAARRPSRGSTCTRAWSGSTARR